MSKKPETEEMAAEFDFANMPGGVRGKYAERYKESSNVVRLDPDVVRAFPNAKSVNDALRLLIAVAEKTR